MLFASRNRGKIEEIRALLAGCGVTLQSLDDYKNMPEIREDGTHSSKML